MNHSCNSPDAHGEGENGARRDRPNSSPTFALPPSPLDQVIFWLVSWVLLVCLYLLLVIDSIDMSELITGAAGAAMGATAATIVRSQRLFSFSPRLRWALGMWRLPLQAVLDTGLLVAVLWGRLVLRRPVGGSFHAVPFRAGGGDPEEAARRAISGVAGSFAPNTYVLDVDRERELILVHQLVSRPDQKNIDPLGLG